MTLLPIALACGAAGSEANSAADASRNSALAELERLAFVPAVELRLEPKYYMYSELSLEEFIERGVSLCC